jgi:hypothetical protein
MNWHCRVSDAELARCVSAAAYRKYRGGNCAARFARRDVRGAQLRGAVELKSGVELNLGARRGCG